MQIIDSINNISYTKAIQFIGFKLTNMNMKLPLRLKPYVLDKFSYITNIKRLKMHLCLNIRDKPLATSC